MPKIEDPRSYLNAAEIVRLAKKTAKYLAELLDTNPERGEDLVEQVVNRVILEGEIVFAVWDDPTKIGGSDIALIKGQELVDEYQRSGRPITHRVAALPVKDREGAEAAKDLAAALGITSTKH